MRFHLRSRKNYLIEVLGESVELPNTGTEMFAVHHAVLFGIDPVDDGADFAVSHVETGLRVASGDTIDEAIEAAKALMLSKTEEQVLQRVAAKRAEIAALEVTA